MLKFYADCRFYKPFDEIQCPLCDGSEFTTIYNTAVYCDHCNSRFSARPLGCDDGYYVDCFTDNVWKERVKYPELLGATIHCFRGEEPPKWRFSSEVLDWPDSKENYLQKLRELHKSN